MSRKIKLNSKLTLGCILSAFLFLSGCSDDDPVNEPQQTPEEPANMTTGFVIRGITSSNNAIARYFEEHPTGTVDISAGSTDFISFFPQSVNDGVIFSNRLDGMPGLSKVVINADGEFVEDGVITLGGFANVIEVRDSEIGIVSDASNSDFISVFNPTTFEVTSSIDMSAGAVPGDITNQYLAFIFRGADVFAPIIGTEGATFTDFIIHQANLDNNTFVGDTRREGNGFGTIVRANDIDQRLTDANGSVYIPDGGNTEGVGIPARLNKILAGSNTIDASYVFEPAITLNPQNTLLPYFSKFTFLESGSAVALVNSEIPPEALQIIIDAGGVNNLTPQQINEIQIIVFQAETAVWCEIDVDALTVTPIEGIPAVSPFAQGNTFEHDGDVFVPVFTDTENIYYRLNPTSGGVSRAFDLTGAFVPSVFILANNN